MSSSLAQFGFSGFLASTTPDRRAAHRRQTLVLNVARLELKTQIYNVSDDELRMLSMATRQDSIIEDS
jgi:hypothetical protein